VADQDETPTPKTSESFAFFREACVLLARRLRECAFVKRHRHDAIDLSGARRAEALASELAHMATRFAAWPTAPSNVVAAERGWLPSRLLDHQREAEELIANAIPPPVRK
jgi:hypothetical protein